MFGIASLSGSMESLSMAAGYSEYGPSDESDSDHWTSGRVSRRSLSSLSSADKGTPRKYFYLIAF